VPKLPKSLPRGKSQLTCKGGLVIGVDEAGRGPWAGPVVVAAAAIDPAGAKELSNGITDSKLLNEAQRLWLYKKLRQSPHVTWTASILSHKRIDKVNILEATLEGMTKAALGVQARLLKKGQRVGKVLIDGNRQPPKLEGSSLPCETVVKGDRTRFSIAAASIIAKVTRDRLMDKLAKRHPQYGFEAHKGYGTASHYAALKKHGCSPVHRRSFEPLKGYLECGRWKKRKG